MQTVNFFMPVNIPTGHPTHILEAAFLGRAIIENESSDEFTADGITANVQDLFFLHDTTLPTETAQRVELPDPKTAEGRMFRSRLETAAKEAFWSLEYGAMECVLPDEYTPKPGDTVTFPTVTTDDIKEARIPESYVNKVIELIGTSTQVFFVDTNNYDAPFEAGYFEVECATESGLVFPLQWLRK